MHKYLSCTISRLRSSEADTIVRMSVHLPGLHPIHLHRFRTGIIEVPFGAVSDGAGVRQLHRVLLARGRRMTHEPKAPTEQLVSKTSSGAHGEIAEIA